MNEPLNQVDPTGRLDVLVFRFLGRIAETQAPHEWPFLEPFVQHQCQKWLGPEGKLWQ